MVVAMAPTSLDHEHDDDGAPSQPRKGKGKRERPDGERVCCQVRLSESSPSRAFIETFFEYASTLLLQLEV